MKDYYFDLGGFAESPEVLEEGTEEAQEAFNYCLASDYMTAIYSEDFESLGAMDNYLLNNILMWYEIGGGSLDSDEEDRIRTGQVVTIKNRSLIEAVLEDRNDYWARTFIINGNHDPRLYALCVTEDEYRGILNSDSKMNRLEYLQFLRDIFNIVEESYSLASGEEKIRMHSCIRSNISGIGYNKKNIGKIYFDDIGSYQFVKDARGKK